MNCSQHTTVIKKQLRQNKLKATPARLGLLDVFEHVKKPLSVTELAKQLNRLGIDKATLYRNVESLEALGLLKKIRLNGRSEYYELASQKHHHHLICKNCGKVADIAGCKIVANNKGPQSQAANEPFLAPRLAYPLKAKDRLAYVANKNLLKKSGFAEISGHSLEFFGICNNCKK